jgi:L1 cell adhesion molecule like protein
MIDARNGLEMYVYNTRNALKNGETESAKSAWTEAESIIEDTIKWIEQNQEGEKDLYVNKQKEVEAVINPIMTKMYGADPAGGAPDPAGGPANIEDVD